MIDELKNDFLAVQPGANQPAQAPKAVLKNEIATVFERVIAFLFDFLFLFSLILWSFVLTVKLTGWMPQTPHIYAVIGGFWILFILYMAACGGGGRTLGATLIGITAINKDTYKPLGPFESFVRALGYTVGLLTFFLGFALAMLNGKRRAVQDLMAGSIVVSTREKTPAESAVISAFGTVLIGLCAFYLYYIFFLGPSLYDKILVKNADEQLARIAYLQVQHKQLFGKYTQDMVRLGLISGDPVQFQRDIQNNLKRRGFSLAVGADGFEIRAVAKDRKETEVFFTFSSN